MSAERKPVLGKHERALLEAISASEANPPIDAPDLVIPLAITHVPDSGRFYYERELMRWVRKVEAKGLIRITNRWFLHSTEKGRAALAASKGAASHG